jgi:hypothetical protein
MVEGKVSDLMKHHGPFDPSDQEWDAQARLEEAVKDYVKETFKREPADSTIRFHVGIALRKLAEN